jgi:hypothetical protein
MRESAAIFNAGDSMPDGVLSQNFDTVAMQLYTVTFDFGNFGVLDQGVTQALQSKCARAQTGLS